MRISWYVATARFIHEPARAAPMVRKSKFPRSATSSARGDGPVRSPASGETLVPKLRKRLRQLLPWRLFLHHLRRQRAAQAGKAIAFDFFLSLLPIVALGAWLLAGVLQADSEAIEQGSLMLDLTPREVRELVDRHFSSASSGGLAPLAAVSCWWLASSAFHTLIHLFQENFDCEPRPYLAVRAISLGFALLGVAILVVGASIGLLLHVEPSGPVASWLAPFLTDQALRWILLLGFLVISTSFFALLYRLSLRRPFVQERVIWPGGLVASLGGIAASTLLGYYVTHLARFALLYGSLVAVVVLVLWLLVWSNALIVGAVVNVTLEDASSLRNELAQSAASAASPPTQTPSPAGNSAGA